MDNPIRSLHHVTATVDDAQEDLDFYVKALGMRLVKKTVNFDNHSVYHFYYGDEHGTPNTLMTTFPYRGWGVPAGTHGAGQVTVTSFSVPEGSLDTWRRRLLDRGHDVRDAGEGLVEHAVVTLERGERVDVERRVVLPRQVHQRDVLAVHLAAPVPEAMHRPAP